MSVRDHLVDLRPLRDNPPFRAFWTGSAISGFGGAMSSFALSYYVWHITGSAVMLGLIGVVQAVPLVVCGLVGGQLADVVNRRSLLSWTRSGQLAVSAVAAAMVLAGVRQVGVLFVVIGVAAGLSSMSAPVAQAITPRLLTGSDLAAGLALTRLSGQLALMAGPAIGGVVAASTSVGVCMLVDVVSFVAALWGIAHVPRGLAQPERGEHTRARGLAGVTGGLRLVLRSPVILGAFLVDVCAMVLALPVALFPVINAERFGGSPVTLGLMLPALGLGGVAAGLFSGRITAQPRQGRVMLVSCAIWGAATAAFGASGALPLALAALVVAGAADTCTVVSRGTIVQSDTPDTLRGRVTSLDYLVGAGGPSLGSLRAGLVAGATSGATSCILGGLACIAGAAAIAASSPRLRGWRMAAAEREHPG